MPMLRKPLLVGGRKRIAPRKVSTPPAQTATAKTGTAMDAMTRITTTTGIDMTGTGTMDMTSTGTQPQKGAQTGAQKGTMGTEAAKTGTGTAAQTAELVRTAGTAETEIGLGVSHDIVAVGTAQEHLLSRGRKMNGR